MFPVSLRTTSKKQLMADLMEGHGSFPGLRQSSCKYDSKNSHCSEYSMSNSSNSKSNSNNTTSSNMGNPGNYNPKP